MAITKYQCTLTWLLKKEKMQTRGNASTCPGNVEDYLVYETDLEYFVLFVSQLPSIVG